jgi:hypothetical protein
VDGVLAMDERGHGAPGVDLQVPAFMGKEERKSIF